ncbi:unnamed protein product, partial [Pocillopora meandrina]
ISCITEHPGFQSICLDFWVLETANCAYRQQQGIRFSARNDLCKKLYVRSILIRWCWEYLGKHFRVAVPSCALNNIRNIFPADFGSPYTGLKPPNL